MEARVHQHCRASDKGLRAGIDVTARADRGPRLIACSLWLYLGFVGASALAAGWVHLIDGGANAPWAWTLTVAAAVLAVVRWRRGRAVLERNERASRVADTSFVARPEVTRLGRHATSCAELAAWPDAAGRPDPVGRR
jgi:hypothetical protein